MRFLGGGGAVDIVYITFKLPNCVKYYIKVDTCLRITVNTHFPPLNTHPPFPRSSLLFSML